MFSKRRIPEVSVYECKECGYLTAQPEEDGGGDSYCPDCGGEVKFDHSRSPSWCSVAVYETSQEWGGPEEGGWTYTAGDVIKSTIRNFEAGDFPAMQEYIRLLKMRYGEQRGIMIDVIPERMAPTGFPVSRPYYC